MTKDQKKQLRTQRKMFEKVIDDMEYEIENKMNDDYILVHNGIRMVIELRPFETLSDTLKRLRENHLKMIELEPKVMERRERMAEYESK